MQLRIDHVQGDPFAAPSRVRARVDAGLPPEIVADPDRRLAAEDWLLRRFAANLHGRSRGSGRSGKLEVYRPGPEVVERSALRVLRGDALRDWRVEGDPEGTVEVRFAVGLPARGRRILGQQALALLAEDVVEAVRSLVVDGDLVVELEAHVASVVRQRALRRQLRERGLVAFVADGSVLPRRSGVDTGPLEGAVPFASPPSLRVALTDPDGAEVHGMGVREGVTVIVGGGFHGKSTLLAALQRGHLDHVPGDGRERVVADPDAVKVRAEDGRRVEAVDISGLLRDLPGGRGTRPFSTDDASGSTSQAAAIVEAVEAGARALLLDEDTSATNLLVRDERMRRLVGREREPITPFVERVRELYERWGVSTVLVIGGVGDYLAVADTVVLMEDWVPRDATDEARALGVPAPPSPEPLQDPLRRRPRPEGLAPGKIRARDDRAIRYGDGEVELLAVEQVLDAAHAFTLGQALRFLHEEILDGRRTVGQALDALDAILDDEGVEALSPRSHPDGALIRPRRHEVAAALNRHRGLAVDSG